ncbi:unnamed protein product [Strongylus vulgaris]|uniref:SH3 domain-containing protein n=1 Tax=Strongylus vulgaris TaxID=40348 RepID=A0A3P7KZY4_STRVU|nr:unnamed protein product [Strongylus vulgaris]
MARVKFEYEPQHNDELRLGEIGQLITIIRKDCGDAGWFEGEINGRRGLFPDNFVELVQVSVLNISLLKVLYFVFGTYWECP